LASTGDDSRIVTDGRFRCQTSLGAIGGAIEVDVALVDEVEASEDGGAVGRGAVVGTVVGSGAIEAADGRWGLPDVVTTSHAPPATATTAAMATVRTRRIRRRLRRRRR